VSSWREVGSGVGALRWFQKRGVVGSGPVWIPITLRRISMMAVKRRGIAVQIRLVDGWILLFVRVAGVARVVAIALRRSWVIPYVVTVCVRVRAVKFIRLCLVWGILTCWRSSGSIRLRRRDESRRLRRDLTSRLFARHLADVLPPERMR